MASFEEIDRARRTLALTDRATLEQIKRAYRRKASRYHPDRGGDEDAMKDLNWAYRLLISYCNNYSYSFSQEDVARTYPRDEVLRKFSHGWFDGI